MRDEPMLPRDWHPVLVGAVFVLSVVLMVLSFMFTPGCTPGQPPPKLSDGEDLGYHEGDSGLGFAIDRPPSWIDDGARLTFDGEPPLRIDDCTGSVIQITSRTDTQGCVVYDGDLRFTFEPGALR